MSDTTQATRVGYAVFEHRTVEVGIPGTPGYTYREETHVLGVYPTRAEARSVEAECVGPEYDPTTIRRVRVPTADYPRYGDYGI